MGASSTDRWIRDASLELLQEAKVSTFLSFLNPKRISEAHRSVVGTELSVGSIRNQFQTKGTWGFDHESLCKEIFWRVLTRQLQIFEQDGGGSRFDFSPCVARLGAANDDEDRAFARIWQLWSICCDVDSVARGLMGEVERISRAGSNARMRGAWLNSPASQVEEIVAVLRDGYFTVSRYATTPALKARLDEAVAWACLWLAPTAQSSRRRVSPILRVPPTSPRSHAVAPARADGSATKHLIVDASIRLIAQASQEDFLAFLAPSSISQRAQQIQRLHAPRSAIDISPSLVSYHCRAAGTQRQFCLETLIGSWITWIQQNPYEESAAPADASARIEGNFEIARTAFAGMLPGASSDAGIDVRERLVMFGELMQDGTRNDVFASTFFGDVVKPLRGSATHSGASKVTQVGVHQMLDHIYQWGSSMRTRSLLDFDPVLATKGWKRLLADAKRV